MTARNYWNGLSGEDIATRHYEEQGASILEVRHRNAGGEIDLIFASDRAVIFVEVKARSSFDAAAHAISPSQWQRILQAAEIYVAEKGLPPDTDLRFDAALIDRSGALRIIENAAPI